MIAHNETGPDPGHADSHKAVLRTSADIITVSGFRTPRDAARIGWAITGILQNLCTSDRVTMTIQPEKTS